MKYSVKQFLAFALSVCLLLGLLPMGALAQESGAEFVAQQVSLGDDLTMKIFFSADSAVAANGAVNVTLDGKAYSSEAISALPTDEEGNYAVSVSVAAAQMTDAIGVTVTDGSQEVISKTYSIRDYAVTLMEGNYSAGTKHMVQQMLNYGAKAQLFFHYKTSTLANAGYSVTSEAVLPEGVADMEIVGKVPGVSYVGASLVCRNKLAVRFYFNVSGEDYTYMVGDQPYQLQTNGQQTYVEVDGINPQDMDKSIVLAVSDGEESLTVSYSPLNYIVRMSAKENSTDELKALLGAMYGYHDAAKSFVGIQLEGKPISIVSHEIIGAWSDDRVWDDGTNNSTLGPQLSYDGDTTTKWDPIANTGYTGEPGIVYDLAGYYDLTKLELTFNSSKFYFTAYGSTDGEDYAQLCKVNSANSSTAYTGNTVSVTVTASSVRYIKLLITGKSDGGPWVGLMEVAVFGLEGKGPEGSEPEITGPEVAFKVTNHEIIGAWSDDRVWDDGTNNSTLGPQLSYDGDTTTKWDPIANTGYTDEPGMIYTLDDYYSVRKLELTFNTPKFYFTVYGSADGINFSQLHQVKASNLAASYVDNTVSISLNTAAIKYIKLVFNGRNDNGPWVGLFEISGSGVKTTQPEQTLQAEKVKIVTNEVFGQWTYDRLGDTKIGPEMSYDGNTTTKWNPQLVSYTGEDGILYTLDGFYDLQKLNLKFASGEKMYFRLYASADKVNYKLVKEVSAANSSIYTDGACTVVDTSSDYVKYVKLIFTGKSSQQTWVNFYEFDIMGLKEKKSVSVSGAFSSHMVLQRNQPIPVWGWAEPGQVITGTFAGSTATATTDADGAWKLTFPAQQANPNGQKMTISGGEKQISFEDVLIGDVYIVNGQSNAELAVNRTAAHLDNAGKEAVKESFRYDNNIRLFHQIKAGVVERSDLWDIPQQDIINPGWSWAVATENDAFWTFSALGMYFAKNVRESLSQDIPIGLIQTAAGGAFLDEILPNELNQQFGYTGKHTVNVGGYYNTMMHPFVGYPIAGMLYFQGESNNYMMADTYARDLAAYIMELRERWGMDFNFYNVQLSSYGQYQVDNNIWPYLPEVRDAQYQVLNSLDNYYLAVSMDIGYAGEVDMGTNVQDYMHPKNKAELGQRVAKQALAVYYDVLEIGEESFSPVPSDVQWNTDGILMSFDNADTLALAVGDTLVGFQCVINEEIVDVAARIVNGNQVLLSVDASTVSEIRYAMFCLGYKENANLINGSGLPAPAFTVRNPGAYTTTKTVIKHSEVSKTGWKSLGVAAALPYHSYDGNMETYWNPQIQSFAEKPSVTYYLNKACVLDGMTLTFINRQQYFNVYTSTDGSTFTLAAQITAENYTDYVATLDGLNISGVVAIRLEFTGSSNNTLWVNFHEIELDAQPIN